MSLDVTALMHHNKKIYLHFNNVFRRYSPGAKSDQFEFRKLTGNSDYASPKDWGWQPNRIVRVVKMETC